MKKHHLIQIIREQVQKALLEDNKILTPRRMEGRWDKKIQDYIKNGSEGRLDLENATITELPPNLKKVGGTLWLSGSKITKLRDGLEVLGDLWLDGTAITELPKGLEVWMNLWLNDTPLSKKYSKDQIRKMIEDLGGTVGRDIFT